MFDGAKTAGELYGRALVVIAAEQHATRLVVPSSQRMPATRWSSHKDIAAKALNKLVGPHVPASLSKLEQASSAPTPPTTRPRPRFASSSTPSGMPSRPSPTTARPTTSSTRTSTTPRKPAPPAGGPNRHPRVARPDGRAGGGGSARQRGGPSPERSPHGPPPQPQAAHRCRAQRAPPGRPRTHRAGRARPADHRRLAALDQGSRQQWPLALQPRQPDDPDRDRVRTAAASPRPTSPAFVPGSQLNRVPRKGERAIRILAPVTVKQCDERGEETGEKRVFFRAVTVWDVRWHRPTARQGARPAGPARRADHRRQPPPPDRPAPSPTPPSWATASRSATSPNTDLAAGATPSAGRIVVANGPGQPAGPHAHPLVEVAYSKCPNALVWVPPCGLSCCSGVVGG